MATDLEAARKKAADYALYMAAQSVLKNNPLGDYFGALVAQDLGIESKSESTVTTVTTVPELPARVATPLPPAPPPSPAPPANVDEDSGPDPEVTRGSSGAIFEARIYVLNCLEKGDVIQKRIVQNLTAMTGPEVSKFIADLQDEARQKGLVKGVTQPAKPWQVIQATANGAKPAAEVADAQEQPPWWSPDKQRYCQFCNEPLIPKKISERYFQTESQYETRKFCSVSHAAKARDRQEREESGD